MTEHADERYLAAMLGGRRVLLTGHTGFKGGWTALWLRRLGAKVVGIALPPVTSASFCEAVQLDDVIDGRCGDIRCAATFNECLQGEEFDVVIHMAAQALVRASFEAPLDTYMTNVIGTAVVLEAARRMQSLRAVIVITSDKCYDNREWVWGYRESDPMGGHDPYSSSKGCAELVTAAYRCSFFNDPDGPQLASARAGNVIGGGDWGADRLIPDIVRAVESGEALRLRNPAHVRPWQHVLEPVRGYLMLAARLLDKGQDFAGPWNFGPDGKSAVDVGTLVTMVGRKWRGEMREPVVIPLENEPHEAGVLRLDSTKANVKLGWKPVLPLDDAVEMTVDWYRQHRRTPVRMRQFSERQMETYVTTWARAA